jgi:hypothetical protein
MKAQQDSAEQPVITAWAVVREEDSALIHTWHKESHAKEYAFKYGGVVVKLTGEIPAKRKEWCSLCGKSYEIEL